LKKVFDNEKPIRYRIGATNRKGFEIMSNIYEVKTIENYSNGEAAHVVQHVYEGTVSVWTSREFAEGIAEDLNEKA